MAELSSQANIKEKISAVRSLVPNKSNNEIVLVLQQFDNNVDKAVQAFMDGSALQVLKEWNMTGKKKNSKRKRSKSKQHFHSRDTKDKDDGAEKVSVESQELYGCHLNGCDKDIFHRKPASEKSKVIPQEENSLEWKDKEETKPEITGQGSLTHCPQASWLPERPSVAPLAQNLSFLFEKYQKVEPKKISIDADQKYVNTTQLPDIFQSSHQSQCNAGRPKSKTYMVKSSVPASHLEIKPEDSIKKRGPNIEKSVKDLQRCTVSLTRYRMMIKEEVDNSVKKIKAAFAELHSCIIDKEVSLIAEADKVKEESMEILTARQKKAEELKRLTDLASQMAETQLAELRAEIKHFVSERKYDEELGRSARFSCDIEELKTQILQCGEISHPKNNYSLRTPSSTLLQSATLHPATSIPSAHTRKSSSRTRAKTPDGNAAMAKVSSQVITNTTESSPQMISANKQNASSSQRRRFHTQYHGIRLNGSLKSQSASNESDQNSPKGNSRHEYRRQHHNSFRSKNKGTFKTQDQSTPAKSTENLTYTEKTRRKQPMPGPTEPRPLCSNIPRVSQCNLCPPRLETSADAPVLSVPAVTLVA
ncbi:SPATS2-like protein isoform X2 [Rhineura floridana]|nr:SPATS2-like protein isoform X2 [Rhineura floridana]XP_061464048.1 SPATS2-like protein isoform X2 [Rhineura floridana]XP_061464049.1 SPATS2-like protein isoform X2 [Rhineura floridana]XP_061464050.1 SPATS2-like protein isoform X2 [Rhineura floridana]XP_061464051.1 SPATS2-like protein isoform X2 [Rhineura floridana]XP_061464052.1 SPATS2-like protein isoform X2 [Rhineura floridana]